MSTNAPKPAIVLNQSMMALILSVITLLGLGFQGSKFLLDTNYRIETLETKWTALDTSQVLLASEIRTLNTSIAELNLVLREVEVRQQLQDRANAAKPKE